jgi:multiple sugar transport system ATP-binding protein
MKITLENLTKVFSSKNQDREVTAVNKMNIEIPDGELVGLLGPSGCGKSTTLFMLSGLEAPTSGKIFFGDQDVTELTPEKRGIGLVFQNYALYPHMTVEQNIMFPLLNMRMNKEEAKARALEAAGLVQIEELMERKPKELSGGQQQRVAIARALVKMPNVLLLDEPLSNLDARLRLQTREEIKRIQKETGITTIFVTHDQEEAMSICDRMVVMKLGVVQQVGQPQAIYDNPDNLFVANFLGTPPINIFKGVISNGSVFIGNEKIMDTEFEDQEVYVGIRPEGFLYDQEGGKLSVQSEYVEVMGRDKSIVATHAESHKPTGQRL